MIDFYGQKIIKIDSQLTKKSFIFNQIEYPLIFSNLFSIWFDQKYLYLFSKQISENEIIDIYQGRVAIKNKLLRKNGIFARFAVVYPYDKNTAMELKLIYG